MTTNLTPLASDFGGDHDMNACQMDDTRTEIEDRLRGAPSSINLAAVLLLIGAVDVVFVTGLLLALAPIHLVWVLPVMIGAPPLAMWIVLKLTWCRWAKRYPAQPQQVDAVIRSNQTFQLGLTGRFNSCVFIAADEHHLHLIPVQFLRLLGARVISLPFDRIQQVGDSARWSLVRATIDGRTIAGPEWCMALARIEENAAEAGSAPTS